MAPRRRAAKAVAKEDAADSRRTGRLEVSPANVGGHSGLVMSTPNEATPRTRSARKPGRKAKWSEEQLLTSDKSLLIHLDLVKLLAHPDAWNCLEESEKREILDLLPPDVHPEAQAIQDDSDTKIPPIPDSFTRYSNNWRDGIRQFQIDLENGRYDSEWLHQAQEARQQRENGEFDEFKEREYEQFWGQKQNVNWNANAGESARVKMRTLIDEGVIQLGDVWRFTYVYGKGADRIVIDKETRIHEINGAKLTFAIPAGERVFLRDTSRKDEHPSTPEKGNSNMKFNVDEDLQPVALPSGDGDMKVDEDTEPQQLILPPSNADVKVDKDTQNRPLTPPPDDQKMRGEDPATHINTTSSTPREAELDVAHVCQEVPLLQSDEMNMGTDSNTQQLVPSSNNEESQGDPPEFRLVVVSPGSKDQASKRTIPDPESQPPKRKRGRQPKRSKQPVSDLPQETTVNQADERDKSEPPLSVTSILEAKIAESQRVAAETAHPEHSHPVPSQQEPSCLPCSAPESPRPESPTPVKEPYIAAVNTNLKADTTEQAMTLDSSMAQFDTVMHGAEVDHHGFGPDPATEQHQDTMAQADTAMPAADAGVEADQREPDTNPVTVQSQISDEPDEIVPDIPTPQALVVKILQIDGRIRDWRPRNSWKIIRCYRDNQDMGSLSDLREAWFLQYGGEV
ncbi:uncharacterized protein N7515_004192 [Penicillium bovifimosum]|uniref:DEUBAD domain-containing protein n=1 Tax=Penicillium bovifimosum TaxID=126998 RepID=A0A9W9H656_9EURO|nr:uncharacterized protein N7515_004192 [Penicillium bovifimosum]KAJ5139344.1 hypothetical protein N7515_004192 [Penicillium bovifimosum]